MGIGSVSMGTVGSVSMCTVDSSSIGTVDSKGPIPLPVGVGGLVVVVFRGGGSGGGDGGGGVGRQQATTHEGAQYEGQCGGQAVLLCAAERMKETN